MSRTADDKKTQPRGRRCVFDMDNISGKRLILAVIGLKGSSHANAHN